MSQVCCSFWGEESMSECAVGIRSGQHSTKIIGLVNPTTINGGGKSFGTHD